MTGRLANRVAVVTGAGRGLGREYAHQLAAHGARVVVNDIGAGMDGREPDAGCAEEVVREIRAAGGTATACLADIGTWQGAEQLISDTRETFGDLHVLINNAGFFRGGPLVDADEDDWDAMINVHLKGTVATSHFAARHWQQQSGAGQEVRASIINTSSVSGLRGIRGQSCYGAVKAGVVTMSLVSAAELAELGVRVNVICPGARTRLTARATFSSQAMGSPEDARRYDPANVAPLIVHLATADCTVTGEVFSVGGGRISAMQGWRPAAKARQETWTPDLVAEALTAFPSGLNTLFAD